MIELILGVVLVVLCIGGLSAAGALWQENQPNGGSITVGVIAVMLGFLGGTCILDFISPAMVS